MGSCPIYFSSWTPISRIPRTSIPRTSASEKLNVTANEKLNATAKVLQAVKQAEMSDTPRWWMTQKRAYRLADSLKLYPGSPGCQLYPNSIVCEYQKLTKKKESIPDLIRVLEARKNGSEVPDPHVAVIHTRLGDGLCVEKDKRCHRKSQGPSDCWNDILDCAATFEKPYYRYAYPKEYYIKVVQELKHVNKVVVMGNMNHFQIRASRNDTSVDERYLSHMTAFFESQGFEVQLRLNGDPDKDFAFACAARTFVKCGGGFSSLMAGVVKAKNNTVLPTNMDHDILYTPPGFTPTWW